MIYLLFKLVHVIAAMVYFGLPMTFARWFRVGAGSGQAATVHGTVGKLRTYCLVHLNLCAAVVLITGFALLEPAGMLVRRAWLATVLAGWVLSLLNLNLLAGHLSGWPRSEGDDMPDPALMRATGQRLTVFAAVHHTLVTLLVVLMIFRGGLPAL